MADLKSCACWGQLCRPRINTRSVHAQHIARRGAGPGDISCVEVIGSGRTGKGSAEISSSAESDARIIGIG